MIKWERENGTVSTGVGEGAELAGLAVVAGHTGHSPGRARRVRVGGGSSRRMRRDCWTT